MKKLATVSHWGRDSDMHDGPLDTCHAEGCTARRQEARLTWRGWLNVLALAG